MQKYKQTITHFYAFLGWPEKERPRKIRKYILSERQNVLSYKHKTHIFIFYFQAGPKWKSLPNRSTNYFLWSSSSSTLFCFQYSSAVSSTSLLFATERINRNNATKSGKANGIKTTRFKEKGNLRLKPFLVAWLRSNPTLLYSLLKVRCQWMFLPKDHQYVILPKQY
jgi:hypothetical protein